MRDLYDDAGMQRIGYWQEIDDLASDGLGGDTPPYWSALEIVIELDYLFIDAWSELYDDPSTASNRFFIRRIHWKKCADRVVATPAIWGEPRIWRRYIAGRVEDAIRDGVRYRPWLYFTFVQDDKPRIEFDEESLGDFLLYAAQPATTPTDERSLYCRLFRAISVLNPRPLARQVSLAIKEHPDLARQVYGLAPNAFHLAITECDGGRTVAQLAGDCRVSQSQIRRVASGIQALRRFSWYRTVVYSADEAARIRDNAPPPKHRKEY